MTGPRKKSGGFTLIETSTALVAIMMVGLALVLLTKQYAVFVGLAARQSFLTVEAPQIGNLLGRLFDQSNSFLVYESRAGAMAGVAPVLTGGKAVRLFFPTATGVILERWITVEPSAGLFQLKCHTVHADDTESSWTVAGRLAGASFGCDQGILSATLQGPNGEEISYYGGSQ
ncbi:MAG: type II secretion system protein [Verrucomicrobiaceae bacterium]|nr:MAG: type II secretion system protein [Verrucomicrobiaceae bacterium]